MFILIHAEAALVHNGYWKSLDPNYSIMTNDEKTYLVLIVDDNYLDDSVTYVMAKENVRKLNGHSLLYILPLLKYFIILR